MMAGVATTCEECDGKRFEASVLDHHLGGRDISEVLAMPVTEAEGFFGDGEARTPAAHKILERLADVGLGYLSLGQPLTTLSGERQRLKLATHMGQTRSRPPSRPPEVYVLDEPTTGLHLADVEQLLGLLDRLVDAGGRSSSSSTTWQSWRTPTGSWASAPAPATTAGGSCSRAPRPTSPPPAPPSPASTWRRTSAPDRAAVTSVAGFAKLRDAMGGVR